MLKEYKLLNKMVNWFLMNTLVASSLGMSLVSMHFSLLNNPQIEIEEFLKTTFYERYGKQLDEMKGGRSKRKRGTCLFEAKRGAARERRAVGQR